MSSVFYCCWFFLSLFQPNKQKMSQTIKPAVTLNTLPDDILTEIFEFAFTLKPKHALRFSQVSKNFHDFFTSARSNTIWKNISNCRWRLINTQMTIATWYEFFKRRFAAQSKRSGGKQQSGDSVPAALIETCELQFRCPLLFVRFFVFFYSGLEPELNFFKISIY